MLIEFNDVSKTFTVKQKPIAAVRKVSWKAESGRIYGILGPNGSGKSTMMRMLLDLQRPDSGTISIDGDPFYNRTSSFKQRVGFLPEERGVYRQDKPLELLTYLAQLKGVPSRSAQATARSLLEELGLGESIEKPLKSYSKGMAQKVQLIAALQHAPDLAILDEPFSGLDPINVKLAREFIAKQRQSGSIVLLCTHRMDEAERLCDHVIMVSKGTIVANSPQLEIRRSLGRPRIVVDADGDLESFDTIERSVPEGTFHRITLRQGVETATFLRELSSRASAIRQLEISPASLAEVYVDRVENHDT